MQSGWWEKEWKLCLSRWSSKSRISCQQERLAANVRPRYPIFWAVDLNFGISFLPGRFEALLISFCVWSARHQRKASGNKEQRRASQHARLISSIYPHKHLSVMPCLPCRAQEGKVLRANWSCSSSPPWPCRWMVSSTWNFNGALNVLLRGWSSQLRALDLFPALRFS